LGEKSPGLWQVIQAVLDTNVIISALLFSDFHRGLFALAQRSFRACLPSSPNPECQLTWSPSICQSEPAWLPETSNKG
jgi:hypothetical protein